MLCELGHKPAQVGAEPDVEGARGREGGGGEIVIDFREVSKVAQWVRAKLGVGGGARNNGASKRRRIGI